MPPPLTFNGWLRADQILASLARVQPSTILEYGVGQGAMAARLAAEAVYTGVEPDEESRRVASDRLPASATLLGSIEPVGDAEFDLVCAFELLEHIDDDRAALRQWIDHVRPGGHLLLSVPAWQHRFGPWDDRVGHLRRYDPADLYDLLVSCGLSDVDIRFVGFPLGYVLERARNRLARRQVDRAATAAERTATSGRLFQPKHAGWITQASTKPFRMVQRQVQDRGTGLVALGRKSTV